MSQKYSSDDLRDLLERAKKDIANSINFIEYALSPAHDKFQFQFHVIETDKFGVCRGCGWIYQDIETEFECGHKPSEHAKKRLDDLNQLLVQLNRINEKSLSTVAIILNGFLSAEDNHLAGTRFSSN